MTLIEAIKNGASVRTRDGRKFLLVRINENDDICGYAPPPGRPKTGYLFWWDKNGRYIPSERHHLDLVMDGEESSESNSVAGSNILNKGFKIKVQKIKHIKHENKVTN